MGVTFTDNEIQILRLLADGDTTREVASKLGMSVSKVDMTKYVLFIKLEARNVAHLVALAIRGKVI